MNIQILNKMDVQIAILGFIFEGDRHGYEIFKELSDPQGFGLVYSFKIGRLYSLLNKSEEEGYVQSKIVPAGKKPPKKIFSLTTKGKRVFEDWMNSPIQHGREIRTLLLIKIFLAEKLNAFSNVSILQTQIDACRGWLENMDSELSSVHVNGSIQMYVNQFRRSQIEGYINWLQWCERKMSNE